MRTLSQKIARTQRIIVKQAPALVRSMTNDAAAYFKKDVWRDEGFDIQPSGRWPKRKKQRTGRLMVKSGRLVKSIVANSRGNVGVVSSSVPYAWYHQNGTSRLPQRKIMGESRKLNRIFDRKIKRAIQRAFEG